MSSVSASSLAQKLSVALSNRDAQQVSAVAREADAVSGIDRAQGIATNQRIGLYSTHYTWPAGEAPIGHGSEFRSAQELAREAMRTDLLGQLGSLATLKNEIAEPSSLIATLDSLSTAQASSPTASLSAMNDALVRAERVSQVADRVLPEVGDFSATLPQNLKALQTELASLQAQRTGLLMAKNRLAERIVDTGFGLMLSAKQRKAPLSLDEQRALEQFQPALNQLKSSGLWSRDVFNNEPCAASRVFDSNRAAIESLKKPLNALAGTEVALKEQWVNELLGAAR